jgi:O-antigen ligase
MSSMPIRTLRRDVQSIQLWTTVVVLVLTPLLFGSVDLFWVAFWTIPLSIGALTCLALPMARAQNNILVVFVILCAVYGLVCIVQITPNLFSGLNDPIWDQAKSVLGIDAAPRISSRSEIPPLAAGHFLLFATALINGFCVGTSSRSAETLIKIAQYTILGYLAYGLVAVVLTPDMLLWADKSAYRGLLTATFVNHNTAATFAGAGTILWACSAYYAAQSIRFSSLRMLLISRSDEAKGLRAILRAAAALVCFFALLETNSRGGLISTAAGLAVAMFLMGAHHRRKKLWRLAAILLAFVSITGTLVARLGRIASQGPFDDNRWSVYGFVFRAIKDHPLFGTGIGTFQDFFPSIRTGDLQSWGLWDYAHSTILEIALEMGVPVAVMVAGAALFSIFLLVRAAVRSDGRVRRSHAAIAGIACLSYLHSTIDFSLQVPGYFVLFAILLGCGLARASAVADVDDRPVRRAGRAKSGADGGPTVSAVLCPPSE